MTLVVASANGLAGVDVAWDVMAAGGSVLDAVEAATRVVEDEPTDHSVGYGGYPNAAGEVELDASIMEGATRRAGAVGGLRRYRHAVTVARAVMERLPHVLVVGDGAARLAAELGMESEDLLTPEAARVWSSRVPPSEHPLIDTANAAVDPDLAAGTVNFLAVDASGRMASAVSTSGWAWKYPGRLGDTPIVGAGNYCDDRYGAAACTGWGELAVRAGTAHSVVASLAAGAALTDACHAAFADLTTLGVPPDRVLMHLVAMDSDGGHGGFSTRPGTSYAIRTPGMVRAELQPRTVIALA